MTFQLIDDPERIYWESGRLAQSSLRVPAPAPIVLATAAANLLAATLYTACDEAAVAGSVRRGRADVNDIDLVLLPKYDAPAVDLWGDAVDAAPTYSRLEQLLLTLCEGRILRPHSTAGLRQRTYIAGPGLAAIAGIKIELWIADQANFGNILALRTGCAAYSRALLVGEDRGGVLGPELVHRGGYLYREGVVVPCRHEIDYFAAAGVRWIEPADRTPEAAEVLRQRGLAALEARMIGVRA